MKVKLEKLFLFKEKSKIKAGEGLSEGNFPFYTSSPTLSKWVDNWQYSDPSLIFGTGGSPSIHYSTDRFSTSTDCIVISKKNDIELNEKFVYYYLLGNLHIIERGFKGAGLKHISKKYIQNIEVPIYPIERQNEIVTLLDKVSSLLKKREDAIAGLDDLLQAQFYIMFGDSYNNPNNYETKKIVEICSKIIDCPHSTPNYVDEITEYPCIRTSEIKGGEIIWDSIKYLNSEGHKVRILRLEPMEGDIVFGREGTVGDAALIPNNVNISLGQRVMLFRVNHELVTPEYFWALLRSNGIQFKIKIRTVGATVKRINIKDVKQIICPVPPLKEQEKFGYLVHKHQAFKEKYFMTFSKTKELFNSLIQQAFSGQLNVLEEVALESLIDDIDLEKDKNDVRDIATVYLRELVEKLNDKDFEHLIQYRKAKKVAFQLLESGILTQRFNDKNKSVELIIKQ
ncbi:restriction endonuclease subunit S [Flavobacterium salilacus subsp. salilacus]|uniref:restriction endonuclease subunit S n=1 Tax=Flavobacterium TaxID=237 RepID=UPI0010757090|nr:MULTISPECIES: restriction endonuclease subunit S [Flavobacterium]KAF2518828.1 restriction endonuclease subunit S [Flavobacterium salilacus subsp. salilacus]MBE1615013.1 restriction endonuclease subunit S [Flavobacterium sp. SaA2.13]